VLQQKKKKKRLGIQQETEQASLLPSGEGRGRKIFRQEKGSSLGS
jgi:hypothetical protein